MAFADVVQHFLVAHFLHVPHLLIAIGRLHADERLRERDGAETAVKEEETQIGIHTEESSDVQVVGQCSRQPHDSDQCLARLNLRNKCIHII